MVKVSVILPSLNVVKYIRETIESVTAQTMREIEIICVDAGSDDGTLEIIEDMSSDDDRILLLRSDKKSYGYQMNIGIAAAAGEYIGIVETDDYIEPDMYETLYRIAKEHDADIVKSDFDVFTKDSEGMRLFVPYSLKRNNRVEYGKIYSGKDYIRGEVKPECYIWNAVYKRDYLAENKISFNETPGASFQDFGFRYQTIYNAERIVATDRSFYHYRRDNADASTYNARTEEYNLRETKFSIDRLRENGIIGERCESAIVSEFIEFAFLPYIEMRKWNEPSEGTEKALDEYRELFTGYMENGSIDSEHLNYNLWVYANLLIEGTDLFIRYSDVIARIERKRILDYLSRMRSEDELVLFGTGIRGNAIYVFLKNNGIESIKAFCDNDTEKQGKSMYGVDIMSPERAVSAYPNAKYIITSVGMEKVMRQQLEHLGVYQNRVSLYTMSTGPLFCTNCLVQDGKIS